MVIVTTTGAFIMLGRFGTRRGPWSHRDSLDTIGFLWQERAAIAELDGGLSREDAEQLAWREVNALLALIEQGSERLPAGAGVTSQWLPPPPSYYGDVTP